MGNSSCGMIPKRKATHHQDDTTPGEEHSIPLVEPVDKKHYFLKVSKTKQEMDLLIADECMALIEDELLSRQLLLEQELDDYTVKTSSHGFLISSVVCTNTAHDMPLNLAVRCTDLVQQDLDMLRATLAGTTPIVRLQRLDLSILECKEKYTREFNIPESLIPKNAREIKTNNVRILNMKLALVSRS